MNDRKLRTIGWLSFLCGTALVCISTALYEFHLPSTITVPVLIVYSVVQYRLATVLYRRLYQSRLADLPVRLRKKYPPSGYEQPARPLDVLLVRPPSAVLSGPDCGESLGLGYLASELKNQGWEARIVDARLQALDAMQTAELILAYNPAALGINLNFQYLAPVTAELLQAVRQRGYTGHITLGGLYASVAAEFLIGNLPEVDTIVRFEGEETYPQLLQNLNNREEWSQIQGLVFRLPDGSAQLNPYRPLIAQIDDIPTPDRQHLPLAVSQGGYAYVLTSRGCKGHCTYCVQQRSVTRPAGKRWRSRDPRQVVDEIEACVTQFGAKKVSFVDDDFFGPFRKEETHAHQVAKEIIARKLETEILISVQPNDVQTEVFALLKKAGLKSVILAVDNFCPAVLKRYGKNSSLADNFHSLEVLKNLEIDAYLGLIIFDPWVTLEELASNFQALQGVPYLRVWQILSKLEVYHGSAIAEELEAQGMLTWEGFSARYQYQDSRIQGVYTAIENILKLAYPAMAEFDRFRWGNLEFTEIDQLVIQHCSKKLTVLNGQFNDSVLELVIQIVRRQQESEAPLLVTQLADQDLSQQAEALSLSTLRQIQVLRTEAKEFARGTAQILSPGDLAPIKR